MPAKIVTQQVEKEVTMMTEPEAQFVSLVKHAANRMPFRVVKSQKGGEHKQMSFVVQSILVPKEMTGPKGSELEKLVSMKGNEWLAEANVEKSEEHQDYVKLVQLPAAKMDATSMQMVKLPGGVLALVGKAAKGADVSRALTISKDQIPQSTMRETMDVEGNQPYVEPEFVSMGPSFGDLLYDEVDYMMGIITGTLRQSASDLPTMKKTILGAVDSFRSFLSIGLDQLAPVAAKAAAKKFEPLMAALNKCAGKCSGGKPAKETDKEEGVMALFETKEEFLAAVQGVVKSEIEAFKLEMSEKAKKPTPAELAAEAAAAGKAKATGDPVISEPNVAPTDTMMPNKGKLEAALVALTEAVSAMKGDITAIATKQEDMGQQLGITPGAAEDPPEPKAKSEEPPAPGAKKASVFAGVLSGKTITRAGVRASFGDV